MRINNFAETSFQVARQIINKEYATRLFCDIFKPNFS